MKTSNKLLLGFLIAVFLLPLCTFFILKGIVKEGKYVVKYYPSDDYYQRGKLTGKYKAIKVIGTADHNLQIEDNTTKNIVPNGGLSCVIHYSDRAYYTYYNHDDSYNGHTIRDSIGLGIIGDTLIIQRFIVDTSKTPVTYYTSIIRNVDLYLPSFQNISVSNATVQLDSNRTENLSIDLSNKAILLLGGGRENTTYSEKSLQYGSSPIVYKNIHISSSKSSIRLNANTLIDSLYLDMKNTSDLSIPDSISIKSIGGAIDKSTVINATSGIYKQLIPLVK